MVIGVIFLLAAIAGILAILAIIGKPGGPTFVAVGLLLIAIAMVIEHGAVLGK